MANTSLLAAFERMWQHVTYALSGKSDISHNHNDTYYTESEIDTKISSVNTSITNITNGTTKVGKATVADSAATATSATSASTATKATQDGNGKVISSTYETKADATSKLTEAKTYTDSAVSDKADVNHNHDSDYDAKGSAETVQDALDAHTDNADIHFTATERTKLSGIEAGAQKNAVTGIKGNSESSYRTGNVNITKANVGLGNVDNTSDANKPVSTAQQTAIDSAIATEVEDRNTAIATAKSSAISTASSDATTKANSAVETANSYTDTKTASLASTTVVDNKISTHNTFTSAHNDIRELITNLTTRLNALANSTDEDLDQMAEIVSYIKSNKSLIDSITTSKVNVADIVDNLTTNITNKPLSAAQGVAIKSLIDALQTAVDGKASSSHSHTITASATDDDVVVLTGTNGTNKVTYSAFHANSGVTAGTYKSVTVNAKGHVTAGSNPTTLSGFGITDAYTKTQVDSIASGKANSEHEHEIADVSGLQDALDGKAATSHGTHVSFDSTNKPKMDGAAAFGTSSKVARADHVHPTDTSRASKTEFDSHTADTTKHITSTERTNWNAAKTHADSAHAPSNAEKNQNAFSNVKVGDTTIVADTTTDTLTLVGSNVTITPDATNDKVTIAVASGSTSAKGLVQLTNSTSSTSTTTAATPNSVKSAYDLANTAKTNAATAQSKADSAYTLAESKVDSLSDLGITATATELNYMDGVTSNVQTQLDGKAPSSHTSNKSNPHGVTLSQLGVNASSTELNRVKGVTSDIQTQLNAKAIIKTLTSEDLNSVVKEGFYNAGGGNKTTNKPSGIDHFGMIVTHNASGTYHTQILMGSDGKQWRRTCTNGTWGNWSIDKLTDTTYSAAGSSLGLVKSGGDVTISSGVITVNDDSHNHTIANIDNLQGTLDGKQATITGGASTITGSNLTANRALISNGSGKVAVSSVTSTELGYLDGVTSAIQTQIDALDDAKSDTGHTHNYAGSSSAGGAATSAKKLTTARKIGDTTFDGTADISLEKIIGRACCSSSSNTKKGKYQKFARINVSDAAWSGCFGTFNVEDVESDNIYGQLNFYVRSNSTIAVTSMNLIWTNVTIGYEASVVAVKVSDGIYDLYYHSLKDYEIASFRLIDCTNRNKITLYENQGWVDSVDIFKTSSLGGNVLCANKLNTNAGSATQPVYFSKGVPVATTYALNKTVPSDAVFTDTNNKVTQTITTTNANYRVLLSSTADDTTRTEGARKDANFYYNPSTNALTVGSIVMGSATMTYDSTVGGIVITFV